MTETDLFKTVLKNNAAAVSFMKDMAKCSQVLDDLVDKDRDVSADTIENVFWLLLIAIPNNPFYREHYEAIWPVMAQVLNDWFVANSFENNHKRNLPKLGDKPQEGSPQIDVISRNDELRLSFVIRDNLAQLLTHCALLLGGYAWMRQHADMIRAYVHDENFESYKASLS